jgi:glycogen operon protein
VDWSLLEANAPLFRFTQRLIRFRRAHSSLRRRTFFEDEAKPLVAWHGTRLGEPDWTDGSRTLGMHLLPTGGDDAIYLIANAHWDAASFELPKLPAGRSWRRFVDTSLEPGEDALEPGAEAPVASLRPYVAGPRSMVVLVGR